MRGAGGQQRRAEEGGDPSWQTSRNTIWARFEAKLRALELQVIDKPLGWVERALASALEEMAADKHAEAERHLDASDRNPTAQEAADLQWTHDRLSIAALRSRMDALEIEIIGSIHPPAVAAAGSPAVETTSAKVSIMAFSVLLCSKLAVSPSETKRTL